VQQVSSLLGAQPVKAALQLTGLQCASPSKAPALGRASGEVNQHQSEPKRGPIERTEPIEYWRVCLLGD